MIITIALVAFVAGFSCCFLGIVGPLVVKEKQTPFRAPGEPWYTWLGVGIGFLLFALVLGIITTI